MKELLFEEAGVSTEGHLGMWYDAARSSTATDAASRIRPLLSDNWGSGVDFPLSSFPEELLAAFPDAEFVLGVRPADRWYRSINSTICAFGTDRLWFMPSLLRLPFFPFTRLARQRLMMDAVIQYRFSPAHASWQALCDDEEGAMAAYDAWNAKVRRVIPAEQLLEFQLGSDGYPELAQFLGVAEPPDPFPRANSGDEFGKIVFGLQTVALLVPLVVGGGMWWWWWRRCSGGGKGPKDA
jgi:hypothetical protein